MEENALYVINRYHKQKQAEQAVLKSYAKLIRCYIKDEEETRLLLEEME